MHIPIIVTLLFVAFLLAGLRMDFEFQRGVIFRLGRFHAIKGPGLYWIIPVIDSKVSIDIRTNTVNLESQETVTRDSVTIKVNAVVYYKITNPDLAIVAVSNYYDAIYQAALITLRNVVGQNILDDVLKNRDAINSAVLKIVDQITQNWGIKMELVEMKDVEIPTTMQRAMAKEAEAIREKRARIIKAEAELESSLKLNTAAQSIQQNPMALELRRMQMISEIGIENNTTTIVMMPSEFVAAAKALANKA